MAEYFTERLKTVRKPEVEKTRDKLAPIQTQFKWLKVTWMRLIITSQLFTPPQITFSGLLSHCWHTLQLSTSVMST